MSMGCQFDDARIDHLGFFVENLALEADRLGKGFGLSQCATGIYSRTDNAAARSLAMSAGEVLFVLTEGGKGDHPAAVYVARHGGGVADIALRVGDVAGAYREAASHGAHVIAPPYERDGVITASIGGFGDVIHTLVGRVPGTNDRMLPGLALLPVTEQATGPRIEGIDHIAVCLEWGQLDATVEFYRRVLGFGTIFEERIVVGAQAMDSKVVQNRSGNVTLTLLEPDASYEPGQIDDFLKCHGGAGVQHIAFAVPDIVHAVDASAANGVLFLKTPDAYYRSLESRFTVHGHSIEDLQSRGILVDQDHSGQLFQIFTKSVYPRGTLFYEVIERRGARTFGSSNIKALYEAVERQRNEMLRDRLT
jgi:4-hydroxymandelate synthase